MFEYIVMVWSYDAESELKYHGIVVADSYGDAMNKLEQYYGEDLVDVHIGAAAAAENDVYEFEDNDGGMFFNIDIKERV